MNNDFNVTTTIEYKTFEKYRQILLKYGFQYAGSTSASRKIRDDLFNDFLDACVNDKPIEPKKLLTSILEKHVKAFAGCQSRACPHYNITCNLNCSLDKKIKCYKNGKQYYSRKRKK